MSNAMAGPLLILGGLLLLVSHAHLALAEEVCAEERKAWDTWMKTANMGEYIADPSVFFKSLWYPSARLATCMNTYFKSEANLATHLISTIPDPEDEHNYILGQPLTINDTWSHYKATVTGLRANEKVQHEHSDLLAQGLTSSLKGQCCLADFSFRLKAPSAFTNHSQKDLRPVTVDGKTLYYCRKGQMVRNFAGSQYRVPIVDTAHFAKKLADGQKVEPPDYNHMLNYAKLQEADLDFTGDADTIKEDVQFAANIFKKGSATNFTEELFVKRANDGKERVAPCSFDDSSSVFYGVLAIEPGDRGKVGHEAPPLPMPQRSMLHMEAHDRVVFARVSSPRAYLIAVRFSCPKSIVALEDFEQCTFPVMWPIKEVTHVSGTGLRPYTTTWQSASLQESTSPYNNIPITFHKEMGTDYEMIVLLSCLGFVAWSLTIVIKLKNRFLPKPPASEPLVSASVAP